MKHAIYDLTDPYEFCTDLSRNGKPRPAQWIVLVTRSIVTVLGVSVRRLAPASARAHPYAAGGPVNDVQYGGNT